MRCAGECRNVTALSSINKHQKENYLVNRSVKGCCLMRMWKILTYGWWDEHHYQSIIGESSLDLGIFGVSVPKLMWLSRVNGIYLVIFWLIFSKNFYFKETPKLKIILKINYFVHYFQFISSSRKCQLAKSLYFEWLLSCDGWLTRCSSILFVHDWKRCVPNKFCKVSESETSSLPLAAPSVDFLIKDRVSPISWTVRVELESALLSQQLLWIIVFFILLIAVLKTSLFSTMFCLLLQCFSRISLLWCLDIFFWFAAQICSLPGYISLFFCQYHS